ncbi:MAG: LysM domain-containing protein [Aeromicrobium sp.]|nr:MAG: LysM domain-containing protein [Aeromicrobium sp.]
MTLRTDLLYWLQSANPEELLVVTLGSLLLVLFLWCAVVWILAHFNRHAAIAIAPPLMRAALVAGLIAGAGSTAHAKESPLDSLNGLALPERPFVANVSHGASASNSNPPPRTQRLPTSGTPSGVHTVVAGDNLWNIAASRLPHEASAQRIAHAVTAWHESNRDVIGTNPDLIKPGQQLKEPQL